MEGGPDAAFIAYCYWLKITFPYLIPVLGVYQIYLITDTRRSLITFGGCSLKCSSGCGFVSNFLNCILQCLFGKGVLPDIGVEPRFGFQERFVTGLSQPGDQQILDKVDRSGKVNCYFNIRSETHTSELK